MNDESLDYPFFQLVVSLQAAAMQQMGKIMSPVTGQLERDLTIAKNTIDLLEMLDRKTTGNLSPEEKKLLDRVLFELRINYVDELKKAEQKEAPAPGADAENTGNTGSGQ